MIDDHVEKKLQGSLRLQIVDGVLALMSIVTLVLLTNQQVSKVLSVTPYCHTKKMKRVPIIRNRKTVHPRIKEAMYKYERSSQLPIITTNYVFRV
jgi:hypothetical protein